uniref:Maltase n=1 Tax=Ornithorhynchus anatinus TaxID=9258 RepID=A0A6I8PKL2_ORNAN
MVPAISYDPVNQVTRITGLRLELGKAYRVEWSLKISDLEKFDCYPDQHGASESTCQQRGCVWEPTSTPGVPFCYITKNYYTAQNIQYSTTGITADLSRSSEPNHLPSTPISALRLVVTFHQDHLLQFKIFDPNSRRYEVPVPVNIPHSPAGTAEAQLYDVKVKEDPFGIEIRRRSTGTVIWNSQLPGFTFNDLFLRISTRLPSRHIYGFGETEHRTFRQDLNWHTWGMFSRDQPPGYKLNSYGVHPYYMALEEDGHAHGVLLLNSNAMDVTLQPMPALTYRTTGGILDFFVVLGPTPELVTQQYTELIGRPAMPPYWALGFQLCRYGYQNDSEIADLYDAMVGLGIVGSLTIPVCSLDLTSRDRGLSSKTLCMESQQFLADGSPVRHYDVHNLYGWSQMKPTFDAVQEATGQRALVISRSTFPSAGRWGGHWLGDNTAAWDQLGKSIIGMMEFSLFGISYTGADICGFFKDADYEMCARWMQLGAFYPFSRNHNTIGTKTFEDLSRNVLITRYTLLPYLYTLMHDAHVNGSTVVRPLLHEYVPQHPAVPTPCCLYHALCVPSPAPGLPHGTEMGSRGQWRNLSAPLDHINLHVRGGHILPCQGPGNNTRYSRRNALGLLVALDENGQATGRLFWDDGQSIGKQHPEAQSGVGPQVGLVDLFVQADGHSPLRLAFQEIKIFGLDLEPVNITVKQNGVPLSTVPITSYDPVNKVARITGLRLELGEAYRVEWSLKVSDLTKIDCYPEEHSASEKNCQQRGCLWEVIHSVIFIEHFLCNYYTAQNIQYSATGITADLTRSAEPNHLPSTPISPLRLDVTFHHDHLLQFKISDPSSRRYEVPVPLNIPHPPARTAEAQLYDVFIKDDPFGIEIRRRSTGTVIWDSQLPGFTFNDLFLRISTRLPSRYIYGFGETEHRTFRQDLDWHTWGMFSRDQPPGYKQNSYGVHPYYMALEEDGHAHGVLLLNSNAMDVTLQPTPALTYRTTGGILDFFVVLGPTPELVTQQYTELIGRPAMPPYWALGFQLCRYGYQNDSEIAELYDQMVAAKIPYDVQYSDIDYMERQLDFTLSPHFAGFPALIDRMKTAGMRVILILDPAISGNETKPYPAFTRGQQDDVFIRWPDGSDIAWGKVWPETRLYRAHVAFPDFFRNSTAAWWKREILELHTNSLEPHKSLKFDGLWIDMNEPASFLGQTGVCWVTQFPVCSPDLASRERGLSSKTLCMESQQFLADGSPVRHYDVHNLYGWSQMKPTYDAIQEATGQRGLVISRSTFPSAGRWGGHWLGDNTAAWDQLGKSIIGMMEFSLFGIPYTGADICGFFNDADYEMCARWMQLGAFYPFSRNHNTIGTKRQDPVAWNKTFEDLSRNVLNARYTLLPYLYTLMHDAHVTGNTVVRPLLHEFVDDKVTWDVFKQFLLGPAFLVSPVLEPVRAEVAAYFPRARWYDYYSGSEVEARGQWKNLSAPLDHINLHIRGGHILPCQEPANNTHFSRVVPGSLYTFGLGLGNLQQSPGSPLSLSDDHDSTTRDANATPWTRQHEERQRARKDRNWPLAIMTEIPGSVTPQPVGQSQDTG